MSLVVDAIQFNGTAITINNIIANINQIKRYSDNLKKLLITSICSFPVDHLQQR